MLSVVPTAEPVRYYTGTIASPPTFKYGYTIIVSRLRVPVAFPVM
jgi:hypothetical protein